MKKVKSLKVEVRKMKEYYYCVMVSSKLTQKVKRARGELMKQKLLIISLREAAKDWGFRMLLRICEGCIISNLEMFSSWKSRVRALNRK